MPIKTETTEIHHFLDVQVERYPDLRAPWLFQIAPNQPVLLVSAKSGRNSGHFLPSRFVVLWAGYRSELEVTCVG